MACTRFLLLAVAMGVLIVDLGAHGSVTRDPRYRKRRSSQSDATHADDPDRDRRQLNIADESSVNVGSNDDLILLRKNDLSGKPSDSAQNTRFIDGSQPSSSSNIPSLGTPGRVPQLDAPPQITRTYFPTDPKLGPSTEVITVGRVPKTSLYVTDTAIHTRVIHVVSTTTELYVSYLTLTVTTGVPVTERPTVTVAGNCNQPIITRYVKDPIETLTVTLPAPVTNDLPPVTFYLKTSSHHSNIVSKTNYNGADLSSYPAYMNLHASSFTTPRTLPSLSGTGYDGSEPSKRSDHGRPSQEQKKVKRSAKTFADDYARTVLYY